MKLLIVDDDSLVALSLRTIVETDPDVTVAAVGGSGREALELFERHKPDILLMDIRMEGMSGLEAGEELLRRHPDARILFLTTFPDDEYIVRALRIGAKGYLLKQEYETLLPALHAVMSGQNVFGSGVASRLPALLSGGVRDLSALGLTEKEADIARLVAEGLSNREIAAKLFLGEGTVRNAISVILEKLGLRSRTQLAVFCCRGNAP